MEHFCIFKAVYLLSTKTQRDVSECIYILDNEQKKKKFCPEYMKTFCFFLCAQNAYQNQTDPRTEARIEPWTTCVVTPLLLM